MTSRLLLRTFLLIAGLASGSTLVLGPQPRATGTGYAGRGTTGGRVCGDDRTVRLWQPTARQLARFARLPSKPLAAAWAPPGDRVAVGCADGRLRALDPDTLEVTGEKAGPGGRVHALVPGPGPRRGLLAGGTGVGRLDW